MTNSKNTKRALLSSVLAMLLCAAMLIGTTFAWFTDSVTAGKNVIQAGNLEITATYQDVDKTAADGAVKYEIPGFTRADSISFADAKVDVNETNAIISEELWEPGAVGAKLITVSNNGSLAAKVKLQFAVEDGGLASALWFDFIQVDDQGGVNGQFTKREMSTLEELAGKVEVPLGPKGDTALADHVSFILVYGMKEEAGNEYMNKSFSADVTILAKQYTYESDSFNNQYDKDAAYYPTIKVTPENAQDVLDGKNGSIDNSIVVFTAGNYDTLVFGRPTRFEGSNTTVTSTTPHRYYTRSISNVIFTAEEGATLSGIVATSGHVYGEGWDYVRDEAFSGHGYYLTHKISNITFKDITFTDKVKFETSQGDTVINGVTFDGCTFTGTGTESTDGQALRYYNENNNGNVMNLAVKNCTFQNWYQGIYTSHIAGITVDNSVFVNTGHNAIAVQNRSETDHKNVTITNNRFENVSDRIIRFGYVGANTQITIQNNTALNCGDDEEKDVMKATSLASGITYDISGNSWGEGTKVSNAELADK